MTRALIGSVLPAARFGDFSFSGTAGFGGFCSGSPHLQLTSVFSETAVDGALSNSPLACSDDDDSAVLAVLSEAVEAEVEVRLRGIFPLGGGETSEIFFKKSI